MKRLASYLIALATMAFTFTSCEDVPSPFGTIVEPEKGETIVVDPAGTGTEADPYNVAGVLEFVTGLGADVQSDKEVYIKGIITEVSDIDTSGSFGNATYNISDDADGKANKFMIYRGFGLGGKKFNEGATPIKAGDNVVIKSKVVNYKGNTPETVANNCIIVELNGVKDGGGGGGGSTGEAKGSGTLADPYNATAANKYIATLAADVESENDIYIKGKLVKYANNGEFSAQFGNASFYISDDGKEASEQFYVFRTLYLGNVKYTDGTTPKAGDEVIICGKVVNYKGNTPETVANKSYIYSLNGETSGGGGGGGGGATSGDGSEGNPYNVAAAIAKGEQSSVYVKAFIVGFVDGQAYDTGATFSSAATGKSNILIAASADETNAANCMPVQLPTGAVRDGVNLQDNAGNYKKEVLLYGDITTYFRVPGLKNTSYAVIDGNAYGTKPGGGGGGGSETGQGADGSKIVSIAEFINAPESNDVWYQLTGTVKNLKDGDIYGNFDLEDATGSVYVYGLLATKGGEKKKFQDLVAAKGIQNGSKITIVGVRGSYQGKVEVMNAYFISIEGGSPGGGSGSGTGVDGSTISTIADFNAAPESNSVWYQLTGTVKNLKDGDIYGNFDLEDATGSVYVYGLLSEKGGEKKKFQDLAKSKGIQNGSKITIVGNRGSYQGKIEVMNAYFVSKDN